MATSWRQNALVDDLPTIRIGIGWLAGLLLDLRASSFTI
jgi:hypothetical protein